MFTIDAHLDLSMNALEWNRDLTRSLAEINAREHGMTDKPDRGNGTVSLPELRKGNVGLVVATQIARFVAPDNPLPGWHSPQQAWAHTQGQLAWYRSMEKQGELKQIRDWQELEAHLAYWNAGEDKSQKAIGYILSLEGADSIVSLDYLETAYENGLRALGPAHYGPGRYAYGTDSSAPLSQQGKDLLRKMDELGIILDATHLCDLAFWDALLVSSVYGAIREQSMLSLPMNTLATEFIALIGDAKAGRPNPAAIQASMAAILTTGTFTAEHVADLTTALQAANLGDIYTLGA